VYNASVIFGLNIKLIILKLLFSVIRLQTLAQARQHIFIYKKLKNFENRFLQFLFLDILTFKIGKKNLCYIQFKFFRYQSSVSY